QHVRDLLLLPCPLLATGFNQRKIGIEVAGVLIDVLGNKRHVLRPKADTLREGPELLDGVRGEASCVTVVVDVLLSATFGAVIVSNLNNRQSARPKESICNAQYALSIAFPGQQFENIGAQEEVVLTACQLKCLFRRLRRDQYWAE